MGSNDGSHRGGMNSRRGSFAFTDKKPLHREARKEWMFKKTGVQEYRGRLKPYTSASKASVESDSTDATPRSRTLAGSRKSSILWQLDPDSTPQRNGTGLAALFGTRVLASWQDLAAAPLFEDSLVDPLPHFNDALAMLITALRSSDDVTGEQLRLNHLTQKAISKLSDASCPAAIRRKCKVIADTVLLYGWAEGAYRPPLILSAADRLRDALLERVDDDASSNGSLYLQDPRNEYLEGIQMTWWQELQADIWEILKPPSTEMTEGDTDHQQESDCCSLKNSVAAFQILVLTGWAVFYCVASLPEYYDPDRGTQRVFDGLEAAFTIYFTLEWLLKVLVAPSIETQLKKPLSVFELVSCIPFYVRMIWVWCGGDSAVTTGFIGHINMVTVLRVFKATAYMGSHLQKLSTVVVASAYTLSVGVFLLGLCILAMGDLMYFVEMRSGAGGYEFIEGTDGNRSFWIRNLEPAVVIDNSTVHYKELSPFQSQLDFYWWCIETITTVGYGDAAPTTGAGRVLAGVCMVIGVLVFAVPASVICSHFTLSKNEALLRNERSQRHEIREYVRDICVKSSESFSQIMLHHFVMLDIVELDHEINPSTSDLATEIYQRILWIYKASRYAEKVLLSEVESKAEKNKETEGDFIPVGSMKNNAAEVCRKRFIANCAEVFRAERTRLWEAYAMIKKKEAMQGS
eukprot:TRINITY_DN16454_c0_g1_i1.p1 TRINITY_DN16454_c0_g1~~TRINITY_DN16454_c0_g1_i1.p1  ORF type:complete len:713 (+),score=160.57 TRINITY_DN16454_c0_g1_i1:77-2140(+)